MEASEILSAFVDGEPVEPGELAVALGAPGARETLIDFVRLRAALADDSQPSAEAVQTIRAQLGARPRPRVLAMLRLAAALVVSVLAVVGAFDLAGGMRRPDRVDEPPVPTRVIRFEPGVDWNPVQGR